MHEGVQLRQLTTWRLGGRPARYAHPREERELAAALRRCRRDGLPWRIMGGGSNLLVDDGPLPYAVIRVHSPGLDGIRAVGNGLLRVGAGLPLARLLDHCRREGLGGLEFLAGIPGTVGGAIAGNAGAWGKQTGNAVKRLWCLAPDGSRLCLRREELEFSYRRLELGDLVIVEAELVVEPVSPELVVARTSRYVRTRTERFPAGMPNAGCVFKNPPGAPAGKLLDLCGLKGHRIGDAVVSRRHANFILNRGSAAARDVLRLIEAMQRAVREQFGIELELEVRHWAGRELAA